jgi:hypothetical protein
VVWCTGTKGKGTEQVKCREPYSARSLRPKREPTLRGIPTVMEALELAVGRGLEAAAAAAVEMVVAGGSEALSVLKSTRFAALKLRGTKPRSAAFER